MKISDLSIKRPVLAAVMSLLLIVLGVMSFLRLTLRELPAIDPPIVSVSVSYPGASAAVALEEQDVPEALRGYEGDRSPLALQDGIGGDRRTVDEVGHRSGVDPGRRKGGEGPLVGIGRCARHLDHLDPRAVHRNEIGERAADFDPDPHAVTLAIVDMKAATA